MPEPDDEAPTARREPATIPDPAQFGHASTLAATSPPPSERASDGAGAGGTITPLPAAIAGAGARYALGHVLGRGGMGEVRIARDPRVDRTVAVKVMRERDAAPDAVARFLREARIQGRLDHPAVVPVHDLGLDERGRPYFAMKRLVGTTLADALAGIRAGDAAAIARWPRRLLLDRFVDVCLAIEFAHARGVVHRDLKPGNLMLGDYGEAYVLDWGIARVTADADAAAIPQGDLGSLDVALAEAGATAVGAMLGTPGYMPPEQMRGEPVDRRADVYALGCVLFEILTHRPALPAGPDAFEATLSAAPHHPRERHPEADVPPELDAVCAAATAFAPADRTATAGEVAAAVRAYLDGDRDLDRRRALAATHAEAARLALVAGDAGRAEAMREAGRALALDPECRAAQVLLRRVLLVPPTEPLPGVERAVAAERDQTSRDQLRVVSVIYFGFLLLVPGAWALGLRASGWVAALVTLVVVNGVLAWWGSRRASPPTPMVYVGLAIHAAILAIAGILAGPLLLAPTLAIGSVAAFSLSPLVRNIPAVVLAHVIAGATPFALEWAGVLPATFTGTEGGLLIRPWAFGGNAASLVAIVVIIFVIQVATTAIMVGMHRRVQERAQERVHLTKWHLDHLLPERSDVADRGEASGVTAPPRSR